MSIAYQPGVTELIRSGETAALLLEAQKHLCGLCVEEVLKRIDRAVTDQSLSADMAVGFVHELAAFRRIVSRQQQEIVVGRNTARRLQESTA